MPPLPLLKSLTQKLAGAARAAPFKGVILVAFVLQIVGEQYPFSNFPMYARLAPETNYMYVADGSDRIVPILPTFGVMGSEIKKMVYSEEKSLKRQKSRKQEREQAAGEGVLDYLLGRVDKRRRAGLLAAGLRVYRVTVTREGERFSTNKELLAEAAPTPATPRP